MKRRVISLVIIGFHLVLLSFALRLSAVAQTGAQPTPPVSDTGLPSLQIRVHQQVPFSLTLGASPATTATLTQPLALTQTVAVTLDLHFDFTLTDTLTATIPSVATLIFANQQTTTLPFSLTIALTPTASLVITPLSPITVTPLLAGDALTDTAGTPITATLALTPTAITTVTTAAAIATTVAITANVRSGPDTTFDVQATFQAGQPVTLVAQNGDGTWYLLDNGLWVAAFLLSEQPTDLPQATEELATALREQNPLTATVALTATTAISDAAPITPTAPVTPTTPGLPTLRPTPTPATPATTAVVTPTTTITPTTPVTTASSITSEPPSVTLDANLREGPGTTFAVVGGTITGQAINIVARNADGSWFRLDNGGWVAAFLVASAPDPTTIPVFDPNAPVTPAAATAAITLTTTLTPTAALTPTFGVRENLYVIRVDGIADRYDFALTQIEGLVSQAQADTTLLENQQWIIQMTTMITLLRSAGDELAGLAVPQLFTAAHQDLLAAATAYTTAADLLAEGIDQLAADTLSQATAQIQAGNTALGAAQTTIERLTP